MRISWAPYAALPGGADRLTASVDGEVLTINGDTIDLSALPEGARIAKAHALHPHLAEPIERTGGELHVILLVPYFDVDGHIEAPPAVTVSNGPVPVPVITGQES